MSNNVSQNLTRKQLAEFLPDPRAVRMFENLLKQVNTLLPGDVGTLYTLVQEAYIDAVSADAKAAQALDALERIANALELLAHGPVAAGSDIAPDDFPTATLSLQGEDNLTPPKLPQQSEDNVAPTSLAQVLEDNLAPPQVPVGTLGTQDSDSVSITGGAIDGTPIGQTSRNVGAFSRAGVGAGTFSDTNLRLGGSIGSSASLTGTYADYVIPATTLTAFYGFTSFPSTVASVFNLPKLSHYRAYQGSFRAGSSVTDQIGFEVNSTLAGASNNYGFHSSIPSGSNNWNFYAPGTARNHFNGNTQIGSVTPTAGDEKLQVNGALSINSAVMLRTYTPFTNGAGAGVGTLTNAPAAGNPTKWIPINDNGTTRYIPAW